MVYFSPSEKIRLHDFKKTGNVDNFHIIRILSLEHKELKRQKDIEVNKMLKIHVRDKSKIASPKTSKSYEIAYIQFDDCKFQ